MLLGGEANDSLAQPPSQFRPGLFDQWFNRPGVEWLCYTSDTRRLLSPVCPVAWHLLLVPFSVTDFEGGLAPGSAFLAAQASAREAKGTFMDVCLCLCFCVKIGPISNN